MITESAASVLRSTPRSHVCRSPRSPGLRRSPRFRSPPEEDSLERQLAHAQPQCRRLRFRNSVEPISVPSSVDVRDQDFSAMPSSGSQTPVPPSSGSLTTVPPNSPARRFSDMTTQSPLPIKSIPSAPIQSSKPNSPRRNSIQPRIEPMPTPPATVIDDNVSPPEDGAVFVENNRGMGDGCARVRIKFADEMTCANAFLETLSVKKLRAVLKHWEWRQSGNKKCFVARALLHMILSCTAGKNLLETMSTHDEMKRYDSWLQRKLEQEESYPLFVNKVLSEEELLALVGSTEAEEYKRRKLSLERARSELHRVGADQDGQPEPSSLLNQNDNSGDVDAAASTAPANDANHFSINEFVRLLIITRQDEDARAAVFAMGQELSRAQLDAGITRGDLWAIVESRFNDPTVRYHLNMSGRIDGVDSRLPPQTHRTATFLKDKFNDAKGSFTDYVTRWSASGRNDPERFAHFLSTLPSGELNALGKRMMVMFTCTRKGTPHEEAHFTNVCCKIIPGGAGRDEGGRNASSTEADDNLRDRQSRDFSRKKKREQDSDNIKDMAASISKIASTYAAKRAGPNPGSTSPNQDDRTLQAYSRRLKKIKLLGKREKLLREIGGDMVGSTMALALRDLRDDVGRDLLSKSSLAMDEEA